MKPMGLNKRRRFTNAAVAGLAMACAAAADAGFVLPDEGVPLDTVIGQTFLVKDKEFRISLFFSPDFDSEDITIKPVNLGLAGIGFDLIYDFSLDEHDDGEFRNFTLLYDVSVLGGEPLINGATLSFDGFALGGNDDNGEKETDAFVAVTELILGIAALNVFADAMGAQMLSDQVFFDLSSSLSIRKNFTVFASDDDFEPDNDDENRAGATMIRQTFSQIPGPGTLGLLGLGGWWLGRGSRRRRSARAAP